RRPGVPAGPSLSAVPELSLLGARRARSPAAISSDLPRSGPARADPREARPHRPIAGSHGAVAPGDVRPAPPPPGSAPPKCPAAPPPCEAPPPEGLWPQNQARQAVRPGGELEPVRSAIRSSGPGDRGVTRRDPVGGRPPRRTREPPGCAFRGGAKALGSATRTP